MPLPVGTWALLVGLQGVRLTRTWKLIRSQCSWPEESSTALFVYRSTPSSRWARGVYRRSSMVALYLMPGGGRGQGPEGEATFPLTTVCLSFKTAPGSQPPPGSPPGWPHRAAPLPSGGPVWAGNSVQRAGDEGERRQERNRREEEGRGGGREIRLTVRESERGGNGGQGECSRRRGDRTRVRVMPM